MTTLEITPNWQKKTAKFKGTVAAGEHVSVSIANDDNFIADATNLRLRVVGLDGRTLAQFPMPETPTPNDAEVLPSFEAPEEPAEESAEAWSGTTTLQCELNLNTVQMLKAVPPAANVSLLWVLDDYDNKTLYFKEQFEVTHWPRRRGEEEPTDLDNYKDIIVDFREDIYGKGGFKDRVENSERAALAAEDSARLAAERAGNSESGAEAAMNAAQTAAAMARNWATGGGETGDPSAENNAKYYAQQAGASATSAATAAANAEAWAVGKRNGVDVPSTDATYENNAKHYAEQAKDSADAAQEAAESISLVLDTTLTEEGKAADAKAVGDALEEKYEKPSGGIPKGDLTSGVQSSLDKADTALQEHQDISGKANKSEMSVTAGTGVNADKTTIQLKSGTSATVLTTHQSLDAYVTGAEYDSGAKKIYLKHGATRLANPIDASAFIKDGMVSAVAIINVPDDETPTGLSSGVYLKVTFNTDAGQDPIYIPLANIFNPANYYDKTTADGRFVAKESGKGLSTNDYTTAEKEKLSGIAAGAQVNAPVDSALSGTSENAVQNKVVKAALDEKYVKPVGGIPASDLADGEQLHRLFYDAEVAYIESPDNSTAYIDTGVVFTPQTKVTVDMQFLYLSQGEADAQQMGFVKGSATGDYRTVLSSANYNVQIFAANQVIPATPGDELNRHVFGADYIAKTCWIDDVSAAISLTPSGTFTEPFYLFARNNDGTAELFCKARVYGAKFYEGGVLVRDFVPVRVGTAGCLYDRVGKQIFYPSGGTLSCGADVVTTPMGRKQDALTPQQLANLAAVSDALAFDATHSYAAGDPVVYNGTLYTFTAAHTGAWTGSDVSAVDIIARLAGKANRAANPTAGNLAALDANGNPTDSQIPKTDVAAKGDLPYAISESIPLTVTSGAAATTLADRTHNVRTVAAPGSGNTTTITATLPPIIEGKSRDMFLNLRVGTQASDAGDISLSIIEPSGATVQIDIGSVEDIGIGKNEILISENALPTTSGNVTTTHWLVTVRHEDFAP